MKFFIKNIFSKSDQIRRKLQIWSHLLKESLIELPFVNLTVYKLIKMAIFIKYVKITNQRKESIDFTSLKTCGYWVLVHNMGHSIQGWTK